MKKGYIEIARVQDIPIYVPQKTWFSFFNSPYPAHKLSSAVDVYFEKEAIMPIEEGRILEIKYFKSVHSSEKEPLILVSIDEKRVLKILHVKPYVKEGEKVYLGDSLGKLVVSKFFFKWTDTHAHFEIREKNDPYRARGAYTLRITPALKVLPNPINEVREFEVVEVNDRYIWVKSRKNDYTASGLVVKAGNNVYCVDGGIPHYGYGVVIGANRITEITFCGSTIGKGELVMEGGLLFKPIKKPKIKNLDLIGVGAYLNKPLLKIIPREKCDLKPGDVLSLKFGE